MDAESRGLVSSLETLSIGSTIGSRCNGMLLCHIDCAAYAAGMQGNSCQQIGAQSCSSCKLVKYCSRACQTAHWPTHKASCKSPYMSASWTTAWDREKRSPAFMTETDLPYSGFGRSLYVWGNLPAIDCMNVAKNEGDAVSGMDLNLAFVASGDLRNMMTTVNGLPSNYNGKCKILLNDLNSTVAGRNTAILFILLSDSELEVEEAAELCLHLQYSAALTRAQATYVFERLAVLFKDGEVDGCFKSIPLRGGGRLYLSLAEISDIVSMVASSYSLRKSIQSMHSVMLAPSRKDFVDRYLFALRGPHRVGEMHLRRTGVLLPFNAPTDHFTEPNRLLFDKSGGWLNPDSASQLSGWDPRQVVETGKQYGCSPDDISGCLFFHVKHVYLDFAKRVEQFKVDIHITSGNAVLLPELLEEHVGYLRHFSPPTFDRIETSNVMDYVDIGQLVGGWSRLLNRANKHSTLLLSTMNWLLWRPDAQAHSLARKGNAIKPVMLRCASYLDLDPHRLTMRSSDSDPKFLTLFQHLDNFHDNSASFRDYLTERIDLSGIAKRNGLVLRITNTVAPRGVGWPLSSQPKIMPPYPEEDWYLLSCLGRVHGHERFLELSVA